MVRTSVRMSELIGGRPGVFGCESLDQYRLNRFRCHEITVSGLTITSADFHSFQILLSPIQTIGLGDAVLVSSHRV